MTRAELLALAAEEINRQDKTSKLPGWLASAEFRINNLLRDRRMVQRALLPIPADGYFTTPNDFLEADSLAIQNYNLVNGFLKPGSKIGTPRYVSAEAVDENPDGYVTPFPGWFTTRGQFIELVGWSSPKPIQAQLFYFAKLPKLINDTDTNWLLEEAPHIYVNAIAHFGFKHLEEDERATMLLQEVAAELQAMTDRSAEMKTLAGPLIAQRAPAYGLRRHR